MSEEEEISNTGSNQQPEAVKPEDPPGSASPSLVKKTKHMDTNEIYKATILNATGGLEAIYIFCAGTCDETHLPELFSDTQLAYFKSENVKILFTEESMIHADDSIQMVKRKLAHELSITKHASTSIEEIYLFSFTQTFVDMNEIYQEATQNDSKPFTKDTFFHYALNLNVDPFSNPAVEDEEVEIKRSTSLGQDSIVHKSPTYETWMELQSSGFYDIALPLGLKFKDHRQYGFSANPFHTQRTMDFTMGSKNPILQFENTLLMNYTSSRDITVCFAKDVFSYAETQGLDESNMCLLYYPSLHSRGITTGPLLEESALDLVDETEKRWTPAVQHYCDTISTFHKIYSLRKTDLDYTERGVGFYSVLISIGDPNQILPLDILFKQIHATAEVPFIKYNPGYRRENMYRLYADKISKNGKKIPLLSETMIMRLSRELGKGNQMAMFLPGSNEHDIYMSLDSKSGILLSGVCSTPILPDALEKILVKRVNPVIRQINGILQSAGYSLRPFLNLTNQDVETSSFTYRASLPIVNKVSLDKQGSYITCMMDVISNNVSSGAQLTYKRVENFRDMDSQSALITQVHRETGRLDSVVQALVDNYGLTEENAGIRLAKYFSEHQQVKGRLLYNPGFPVVFKMRPLKSEVVVDVEGIVSLAYVDLLHICIDTILRLTQNPTSTYVVSKELKKFRAKTKVVVDQDELMAEENVVAPSGVEPLEFYKVQPLRFGQQTEVLHDPKDQLDPVEDKDLANNGEGDGHGALEDEADDEDEDKDVFLFDDDYAYDQEEEEDGNNEEKDPIMGGEGSSEEPEEQEKYQETVEGLSIKGPTSYFVKRMQDRDPKLFLTEVKGNYDLYSRTCPSSDKRQPVILTDEEKTRIDKTNPGSYEHAVKYGSNPNKQFWYVCPRYWCLKTNSSISEEDVKSGKCGTVIPANAKTVPKGAYVYEFSNPKEHIDKNGQYIKHVPGFLEKDKHPDGLCIPCCFKKAWDAKQNRDRREQCAADSELDPSDKPAKKGKKGSEQGNVQDKDKDKGKKGGPTMAPKVVSYVMSPVSVPLPQHRWGFLPMSIQLFLDTDNSSATEKQNPALIRPGASCLLRYGVEHAGEQSFLGIIAHFYAYKHNMKNVPSIAEIREILTRSISLDLFLKYQNGNLPGIFRPKQMEQWAVDIDAYTQTEFYKRLSPNLRDEAQLDYVEDTIASYENFLDYVRDEASNIDHTYLWDMFCDNNPLFMRDGFNLVILQLPEKDITDNVEMVCPSNFYSSIAYDATKETVILVKQDVYYEPIHWYEQLTTGDVSVKKAFLERTMPENIKEMLSLIQAASKTMCSPRPSKPNVYRFKQGLSVQDSVRVLKTHNYRVKSQIANYRNKIIGLQVNKEDEESMIFVPCYPSSMVQGIPIKQMDDDDLWLNYRDTRDRLIGIGQETGGKIACKPAMKILDPGDALIVGFLTESNQFVQIDPPQQAGYDDDEIEVLQQSDYALKGNSAITRNNADKTMSLLKKEDVDRVSAIRKISLESQFYNVFRSLVRIELNHYENREIRKRVADILESPSTLYHTKVKTIEDGVRSILMDHAVFQEFDAETLTEFEDIVLCSQDSSIPEDEIGGRCSDKKYCLTIEGGKCKSIFPKKHLISGGDNEKIYFSRIADELIRYRRIRVFLLYPKQYLNVSKTEYNIRDDELFLLETLLNKEYFRDLVKYNMNKHVKHIGFDNANPESSQTYENRVSLKEQDDLIAETTKKTGVSEYILDCIEETLPKVVGNDKTGSWKTYFPPATKELVFSSSVLCSFIPMIYILQERAKGKVSISVQNIKTQLWNGYSQYIGLYGDKITAILRNQGKRELMDMVKKGKSTFEHVLFSDLYYITDLDWWVFCEVSKLPVILFSSTLLKSISTSFQWLRLARGNNKEKYWFVRSPADVKPNSVPKYHVVIPPYSFTEMRNNEMFLSAERGNEKNISLTLEEYLSTYHFISRGKP